MVSFELSGKVALVTGASKNIGKGIALEVGASGAVTYLTARSVEDVPGQLASLNRTVAEIEARGGTAIPVACDHTDDAQVEAVFDRITAEQGRLDLVVNVASPDFSEMVGVSFWDLPFKHISGVPRHRPAVELRDHRAGGRRMMIEQRFRAWSINISSHGAESYLLSVPYGVGKAAIDKVTRDTAFELKPHGVAVVSLWPGLVLTEGLLANTVVTDDGRRELHGLDISFGETPKFNGLAVSRWRPTPTSSSAAAARSGPPRWPGSTASPRTTATCPPEMANTRAHRHGRRHARLLARRRARRAVGVGRSHERLPALPDRQRDRASTPTRCSTSSGRPSRWSRVQLPFGEPCWMLTRYEDVRSMLADPRFSRTATIGTDVGRMAEFFPIEDSILGMDAPEHTRIRRLVSATFTARRMQALRGARAGDRRRPARRHGAVPSSRSTSCRRSRCRCRSP